MTRKATADTQLQALRREVKMIHRDRQQWANAARDERLLRIKAEQQVAQLESDIKAWEARFDALLRRDQA